MTDRLDLEAIKRRVQIGFDAYAKGKAPTDVTDRAALIAEVERLRAEVERKDEALSAITYHAIGPNARTDCLSIRNVARAALSGED